MLTPQECASNMLKKYGKEALDQAWHYAMQNKHADVPNETAASYWIAVHRWIRTQTHRAPYWRRKDC